MCIILSKFNKILKKLLFNKLYSFLESDKCIYLIPIKIRAPLNFAPLIFAPLIFTHLQNLRPFDFHAPLFYSKFAILSFIFSPPLIFALSYCAKLLPIIFAQARCTKIKGAQILMGIRYDLQFGFRTFYRLYLA